MVNFDGLEFLRQRLADAQKAFEEEKARFAKATVAWQSANNLVLACQRLIDEEERRQQSAGAPTLPIAFVVETETMDTNKTKLIRDILKQHTGGIAPGELWDLVSGKIKHRPYLYSVLKRLSDRKEVAKRRGKYYFVEPPEERSAPPSEGQPEAAQ
jgi:predicted RNA-binding protein